MIHMKSARPFCGSPRLEIWRGFCIQSGHCKFEKRLLLLQNGIIKSIYFHTVVPKSTFELRQSSVSTGRKFYFRVRVNNNLKSERHGYLLHLIKQVRQSSSMNFLSKLVAYYYGSSRLAHLFLE